MSKKFWASLCTVLIGSTSLSFAATISVPADHATIQAAITASSNGDTISVAPGTYSENIDFQGKAINLSSSGTAAQTTIDGGGSGSVVTFNNNETSSSIIDGFTITNGVAPASSGGGITINSASPIVRNNIIEVNVGGWGGTGIGLTSSNALIENNLIQKNRPESGVSGGGNAAAIDIEQASSPVIKNNKIISNYSVLGSGSYSGNAGISVQYGASPTITGNLIQGNTGGCHSSGIAFENSGGIASNNVIVDNKSTNNCSSGQTLAGGGVYISGSSPTITNNTFSGNSSIEAGSEIAIYSGASSPHIQNNIFNNQGTKSLVYCEDLITPLFSHNLFYAPNTSSLFSGSCVSQAGIAGNISAEPQFVSTEFDDYSLLGSSPAIDTGGNVYVTDAQDFNGNTRIINGSGTATVDLGAIEFGINTAPYMRNLPVSIFMDNVDTYSFNSEVFLIDNSGSAQNLQLSLTTSTALISLKESSGLSFIHGTGSNDTNIVVQGSLAALESSLNSLSLNSDVQDLTIDTLTIELDDLGNAGTGGAQKVTDVIPVSIEDERPPTISFTGLPTSTLDVSTEFTVQINFSEDASDFIASDISVTFGSLTSFTKIDDRTYTVSIKPSGLFNHTTINIHEGAALDDGGNKSPAAQAVVDLSGATSTSEQLTTGAPTTEEAKNSGSGSISYFFILFYLALYVLVKTIVTTQQRGE